VGEPSPGGGTVNETGVNPSTGASPEIVSGALEMGWDDEASTVDGASNGTNDVASPSLV
jgi:hypothetical protein